MEFNRREYLKLGGATAGGLALSGCLDTLTGGDGEYPDRDLRWVVIYGAGGSIDTHGRQFAEEIPNHLPGDVDITAENVTGGGGVTGTNDIYNSEPDGYTMGGIHGPAITGTQVLQDVDYDVFEMDIVGRTSLTPHVLVTRPDLGYDSIHDVIDSDETLSMASSGAAHNVLVVPPLDNLGVPFDIVSGYDGTAEMLTGLLREDVELFQGSFNNPTLIEEINDGNVQPLLYYSDDAPPAFDSPNAAEEGFDDLVDAVGMSHEVMLPPGTEDEHPDRVETLRQAFDDALNSDAMQEWSDEGNQNVGGATIEEIEDALQNWADLYEASSDLLDDYV